MDPETFAPHEPTDNDWRDAANALEQENATLTDRLEALTQELALCRDTLTERSEAVNRTGASNDRLRATVARVEKVADAWDGYGHGVYNIHLDPECPACDLLANLRTALADQEPARD